MNTWIVLSGEDLRSVLNPAELSAYMARSTTDDLDDMVQDVVVTIREAVANNRANVLGPDGTIPRSLRREALAIARMDLITMCDVRYGETDPRPLAAKKAEEKLKMIAAGTWQIAGAGDEVSTPPSQSPEIISPDPPYTLNPRGIYNL